MKTVQYKTTINCANCIKSVTPFLNEVENIDLWKVDTESSDKILEVTLEDDNEAPTIEAVKKAGFKIEPL